MLSMRAHVKLLARSQHARECALSRTRAQKCTLSSGCSQDGARVCVRRYARVDDADVLREVRQSLHNAMLR